MVMKFGKKISICILACFCSTACTVPRIGLNQEFFDSSGRSVSENSPSTAIITSRVSRIVDHIACELARATKASGVPEDFGKNYVVSIFLTVQFDDEAQFNPSLGFIAPLNSFSGTGNSFTKTVGGQLSRSRSTNFTGSYVFVLSELKSDCSDAPQKELLTGSLNLLDYIRVGMHAIGPDDPKGVQWADTKSVAAASPDFGATIKFITVEGLNASPGLKTPRFSGFAGGQNGLLNYMRTSTDTLVIAFAPQCEVDPVSGSCADVAAPVANPPAQAAAPALGALKPKDLKYALVGYTTKAEILKFAPANQPPAPAAAEPVDQSRRASAISQANQLLNTMIFQNINR
jgi:hypothetical protein